MKLRDILGFQIGINKLNSLPLYKAMPVGNWLQSFQQPMTVSYSKGPTS